MGLGLLLLLVVGMGMVVVVEGELRTGLELDHMLLSYFVLWRVHHSH